MQQELLFERLNGPARVVVLHAESGSGKTVLVANWARQRQAQGLPTPWILIDADSGDSRRFWARVATGIHAVLPEQTGAVLIGVQGGALPTGEAIAAVSSALMAAPNSVTLVIDDLHLVEEAGQAELVALLSRTPWLRLVVTTRRRTIFESAATRLTLGTEVINSADLALSASEIVAIAQTAGVELSVPEAERLRRITRGGALAVRIALAEYRPTDSGSTVSRARERRVNDALSDAAEATLDVFTSDNERQLARRFALSPELDEPLAIEIAGTPTAWEIVESFEARGLGHIEARRAGRAVFTFYALPLAGLRGEGKQLLSAEDSRAIRVRAARRLAAIGDPVDVLRLLLESGLDRSVWGQFVRRMSEIGPDRHNEMVDLLYGLPKERIERDGTLAMVLAVTVSDRVLRSAGRTERLIRAGLAELLARPAPEDVTDRYLLELARFVGHRTLREYPEAREIAHRILRPTVEFETGATARTGDGRTMLYDFSIANLLAGDLQGVIDAAAAITEEAYPAAIPLRSGMTAISHAIRGDMQSAERAAEQLQEAELAPFAGSQACTAWRLTRAHLLFEQGSVLDAFAELDGLRDRLPESEMWPVVLWTSAYTRLVTGAAERGAAELDRHLEQMKRSPLSPEWEERLRAMRADLLLASGTASKAAEAIGGPATTAPVLNTLARIALVMGRPEEALSRLTLLSAQTLRPREAADYHLLVAASQRRLGRIEVAKHALEKALHRIRETRLRSLLSFVSVEDLVLLRPHAPAALWLEPLAQPFSLTALGEALTEREARVLSELVIGDQISQIAERLHVSPNTVKSQLRSVYRKLGVSGREEAIRAAADHGLL